MNPPPFVLFRAVFGAYLVLHFAQLVPYADELFGMQGLLADPSLNPLHGLFPNPLAVWDIATEWCVVLSVLALSFAIGFKQRTCALLLWFGSTALFHRNNLTANPSLAYLGLLLVFCAMQPRDGKMPRSFLLCAWVLLAAGYTFSGITKLESPSWMDGSALARLMDTPLARDWPPRLWFLALPAWLTQGLTWLTLALELLYLPLCLFASGRKWAWFGMVAIHAGILLLVDFADLTFGMLMTHLFVFDSRWLPRRLQTSDSHEKLPVMA